MKKALYLIFYNIIIVVVILLLLEFGVRIFSSNIVTQGTDQSILLENRYYSTPGLKPNSEGYVFGKEIHVNEFGFLRNACVSKKKRKKVLFFGDSVTMGVGVDEDSTFVARLQQHYCDSLEIDNVALIGYNINDYERIIKKMKEENTLSNYDQILFFFCLNDNYLQKAVKGAADQETVFSSLFTALKSSSYLYIGLKGLASDRSKIYYDFDRALYKDSILLHNLDSKISSIVEFVSSDKISFILLPYEYQLRENYSKNNLPQQEMQGMLKKKSIVNFDIAPSLVKSTHEANDLYLYADGIHFSSMGHCEVAKYVIENKVLHQ